MLYVLSGISPTLLAQERGLPFIRNYSAEEYGGAPQILGLAQDTLGMLYIGGEMLLQYDGVEWRSIPTKTGVVYNLATHKPSSTIYVASSNDFGRIVRDSIQNMVTEELM